MLSWGLRLPCSLQQGVWEVHSCGCCRALEHGGGQGLPCWGLRRAGGVTQVSGRRQQPGPLAVISLPGWVCLAWLVGFLPLGLALRWALAVEFIPRALVLADGVVLLGAEGWLHLASDSALCPPPHLSFLLGVLQCCGAN